MIQDIAPHVYHNEYHNAPPQLGDRVLFGNRSGVFCRLEEGALCFPAYEDCGEDGGPYRYLFQIDETQFFLGLGKEPAGYDYQPVQVCRQAENREAAFAGVTAFQLAQWYRDSSFCGRCGCETEPDKKERMMRCPNCDNMIFPRISPAVIVAVTDGERILLTRYANRPVKNFALIAGFTEIGESVEETVHREVLEEVGLRVKNLRFYKSQPWSFTGCLLCGFFCDLDGLADITLQEEELSEGVWVNRKDLNIPFDGISLTNEMICLFAKDEEPK